MSEALFPRPVNCSCGNEISWAAAIEAFSMKSPYYAVVCNKCHISGPAAKTPLGAALKWNYYGIITETRLKR